jgi:MSHA biogenesis protein MshK
MNRALVLPLLCYACATWAQGGALVDPTRPPTLTTASGREESAAPSGPQLQSVLISPTRRVAVISGSTVVQGGKYGNATVSSISEGAVLLRYADRKETLHLLPRVMKRERPTDTAAQTQKGNSR